MARTIVGLNDPKAVKKYSAFLAVDVAKKSYWSRKFMGKGEESSMPIQQLVDLETDAGEYISFDLSMQLKMQPVEGDDVLENKEEDLKFYTDGIYIDQMRGGVNAGGRMTRKRTIHSLRKTARRRSSDWWQRAFDELIFMYGSGARGDNADYIYPTTYAGFANNPLSAPDTEHIQIAGNSTLADVAATDKMQLTEIDKAVAIATVMGGGSGGGDAGTDGNTQTPKIQPIMINGERHFCLLMHPYQVFDLRTSTVAGQWLDIQKAAAGAEGRKSPIFKGTLGKYNNVIMHEHESVIRFIGDYGTANIDAARALFMGEQSMVLAFGTAGTGLRFSWHEESRDNGNQAIISTASIFGVKKVTFNGKDFGMYVIDTAAVEPQVTPLS
jgi:N4-gp56 family major capsid protein